jgi:proteic killer suppression protein
LLQRNYGEKQANLIAKCLTALQASATLGDFWPPYEGFRRCHALKGNRAGMLSMDLLQPYRLIFKPANDPIPQRSEGGLDWHRVTAIMVIGVENTHE